MKKILVFLIVAVFLTSFVFAQIIGSVAQDNNGRGQNENKISASNQDKGTLTQSQIKNIIKDKNKLKIHNVGDASECPNTCTCTGSVTKCQLQSGREMTITAGKSGNIIVQIKGENMTTNVTLYKAEDGKVYRITKNNETKRVKLMPDQIKDKIKEKIKAKIHNESIELDEDGNYQVQAQKDVKLFGLFKIKEKVKWEYNSETGELTKTKTSWWGFLAKDEKEELLGASCGTVSPDSRDECCQDKGYDIYDLEKDECVFSE